MNDLSQDNMVLITIKYLKIRVKKSKFDNNSNMSSM